MCKWRGGGGIVCVFYFFFFFLSCCLVFKFVNVKHSELFLLEKCSINKVWFDFIECSLTFYYTLVAYITFCLILHE